MTATLLSLPYGNSMQLPQHCQVLGFSCLKWFFNALLQGWHLFAILHFPVALCWVLSPLTHIYDVLHLHGILYPTASGTFRYPMGNNRVAQHWDAFSGKQLRAPTHSDCTTRAELIPLFQSSQGHSSATLKPKEQPVLPASSAAPSRSRSSRGRGAPALTLSKSCTMAAGSLSENLGTGTSMMAMLSSSRMSASSAMGRKYGSTARSRASFSK